MKDIVLSADGPSRVYSVPNVVADNLEKYCWKFNTDWLRNAPRRTENTPTSIFDA